MQFVKTAIRRMGTAGELLQFSARSKRWWLTPVILVVLFTAVLIIVAQSAAIVPFIYALF